jgi:hypothetical protein
MCNKSLPIPMAARCKAWNCGRLRPGILGSNTPGYMVIYLFAVLCVCQVDVSAWRLTLVQRTPTDSAVSEFNRESSIMRRPWSTGGCWAMVNK